MNLLAGLFINHHSEDVIEQILLNPCKILSKYFDFADFLAKIETIEVS